MKRTLFFLIASLGFWGSSLGQSEAVSDFNERYEHEMKLFFYPSTLRMVNVADDPDYKLLIKDIEKARWLTFNKEKTGLGADAIKALKKEIASEQYEELISMVSKQDKIFVYIQEDGGKPSGLIGMVENEGEFSVFDVKGFINVKSLSKLINSGFKFGELHKELMENVKGQMQK